MHYASLSLKKIQIILAVVALLITSTWLTFAVTEAKFGNLSIPVALNRSIEKQYLYLYYLFWFSEMQPKAFFGMLGGRDFSHTAQKKAEAIPVIFYHAIIDKPDGHNITKDNFMEQMYALKAEGWESVTLEEFLAFLRGEIDLPQKSFLIAFDDGAKDSYYPVDPLLRVTDWTALTFILSKYSAGEGSYYYLSAGEIDTMLKSGRWELGSHGRDAHAFLPVDDRGTEAAALANRLWLSEKNRLETAEEYEARIQDEFAGARQVLEERFKRPVSVYAFPFGDFGQLSLNHTEAGEIVPRLAAGVYDYGFYQVRFAEGLTYNYRDKVVPPSFLIRRIEVHPEWNASDLLSVLHNGMPKTLPYTDSFEGNGGWRSVWGELSFENGALNLKATPELSGNAAILDGTGNLKNYAFTITGHSPSGTGTVLWARFRDGDNNVACNFDNNFIHIEEVVNGTHRVVKGLREPSQNLFPEGRFSLGIEVNDRHAKCLINDQVVLESDFLDPTLAQGGVGIKIWEGSPGVAALSIEEAAILPISALQ